MKEELTIREWISQFNSGDFDDKDSIGNQRYAGWSDWSCKDSLLVNKTKKLGNIIKNITNDFILNNYYMWFTNSHPSGYSPYDIIHFESKDLSKRNKLYFYVVIDCAYEESKYTIYTTRARYGLAKPEFNLASKKDLISCINHLGESLNK